MNEQEKVDDLIAMLDNLMESGQGHVNVFCDGSQGDVTCEATVSKDCGCGNNTACQIPTMFFQEEDEQAEEQK